MRYVGKGVHVVTVNDYLANRDAEWMGKVFRFLGMSVGTVVHGYNDIHKIKLSMIVMSLTVLTLSLVLTTCETI